MTWHRRKHRYPHWVNTAPTQLVIIPWHGWPVHDFPFFSLFFNQSAVSLRNQLRAHNLITPFLIITWVAASKLGHSIVWPLRGITNSRPQVARAERSPMRLKMADKGCPPQSLSPIPLSRLDFRKTQSRKPRRQHADTMRLCRAWNAGATFHSASADDRRVSGSCGARAQNRCIPQKERSCAASFPFQLTGKQFPGRPSCARCLGGAFPREPPLSRLSYA